MTLPRAIGLAGTVLITVGGLAAGAVPYAVPAWQPSGLVAVYAGLALLTAGWWWHGRAGGTAREAAVTLGIWCAPLLLAPPMFSRDVYSYLAQGLMTAAGLDVYRHGPAALGGQVAEQVPGVWLHAPSPYGPAFQLVAQAVTAVSDNHVTTGVLAWRGVARGGRAGVGAASPGRPRAAGSAPPTALWLAALNPLTVIHLVGGAHNDALMIGLLAAGLAAAVRHRPVVATVLVAGAALVKAPAALGLCAIAVIWAAHLPGRFAIPRAALVVGAIATAVTVVVTRAAGTGYGWISALKTPVHPDVWSPVPGQWRWTGMLGTVVVMALVWVHRERLGAVQGLGIVLLALVLLGPALRPWYLIWALVPLAVSLEARFRVAVAVGCAALTAAVMPDGFAPSGEQVLLATAGALGAAIGCLAVAPVRTLAVTR